MKKPILTILLLALIIRMLVFAVNPETILRKDAREYELLAWNLLQGHGFSTDDYQPYEPIAYRTPLYPIFIAGIYFIVGRNPLIVRLFQIAISAFSCIILFQIARCVLKDNEAFFAGLIAAVLPLGLSLYANAILTETLQTLLLLTSVYLAYKVIEIDKLRWCILLGMTIGLAALNRPESQFLPLIIGNVFIFSFRKRLKAMKHFLIMLGLFAIVITPWLIRNYLTFQYVGLASGTGHSAIVGLLEAEGYQHERLHNKLQELFGDERYIDGARPDRDAIRKEYFRRFVFSYPWTYLKYSVKRFIKLWTPRSWSDAFGIRYGFTEYWQAQNYTVFVLKTLLLLIHVPIILLGWLGVFFSLREWRKFAIMHAIVIYFSIIYSTLIAYARYRLPITPLLIIWAIYASFAILSMLKRIYKMRSFCV